MIKKPLWFLFIFVTFLHAAPAKAQGNIEARIDNIFHLYGDDYALLLYIDLEEGWHTYWKVPGDTGLPPRFNWDESENASNFSVLWPAPVRKEEFGFQAYGYDRSFAFPVTLTIPDVEEESKVDLKLDIMICKDICIPHQFELTNTFTPQPGKPDMAAKTNYDAAIERIPVTPIKGYDFKIDNVVLGPDAIVISASSDKGFEGVDVFPVKGEDYAFTAKPEIIMDANDPAKALIKIAKPDDIDDLIKFFEDSFFYVVMTKEGEAAVEYQTSFK